MIGPCGTDAGAESPGGQCGCDRVGKHQRCDLGRECRLAQEGRGDAPRADSAVAADGIECRASGLEEHEMGILLRFEEQRNRVRERNVMFGGMGGKIDRGSARLPAQMKVPP